MARTSWDVRLSCSSCGGATVVRLSGAGLDEAFVRDFAEMTVGRSRFFVKPVERDDPGPCGRCAACGVRALDFEILSEIEDVLDPRFER